MTNLKKLSDEELVKLSLSDISYFAELVNRYEKKLYYFVKRITSYKNEIIEEILQESFIDIWKNLNSFNQDYKFSSWVYQITRNKTIDYYRKENKKTEDILDNSEEIFAIIPDKLDLEKEIEQKLNSKIIAKHLKKLPLKYQEVLILKFYEDKSYQEISDILKKPEGTIATLLNRAKNSFKEILIRYNQTEL
jgi:RNA polymerase sigma-70 factor (ECF subfamily)